MLATLALCVATGIMASRDLRRDLSAERATWRAMVPRLLLVLATAFCGMRLILVTASMLHPSLYDGMAQVMEPRDVAVIGGGFWLFGVGLAARAVSPRVPVSVEAQRLFAALRIAGGSIVLALTSLSILGHAAVPGGFDPDWVNAGAGMMADARVWLMGRYPFLAECAPYLQVPVIAWGLTLAWLAIMVATVNLKKPGSEVSPLDGIGATWSRLAWFLWCSSALAVVCLAALPALALGGLAIENLRYRPGGIFG